mgnify:CR=1 FL=1
MNLKVRVPPMGDSLMILKPHSLHGIIMIDENGAIEPVGQGIVRGAA